MFVVRPGVDLLVQRPWIAVFLAAALLTAVCISRRRKPDDLEHIPCSGQGTPRKRLQEYRLHAKRLYGDGYKKFQSLYRVLSPEATGKATPELSRVARDAVLSEIPQSSDWTEVDVHHQLVRIVTIVSGWMFVGPDFCRTDEYMDLAAHYAADAFGGPLVLQMFPKALRSIVAPLVPPVRRVWKAHRRIAALLGPAIAQRQRNTGPGSQPAPDDMLQWLIDNRHQFPDEIKGDGDIARLQLALSAVAIHTTALTATATLYDLAAEPEIMQDVREEIHRVLQEHDGKITSKMLFDLKLLDAVCKESQRLNPADLRMCLVPYPPPPNHVTQSDHRCSVSARRRVMQPFTFSDGTAVPVGTMLAVPVYHIGRDPALFPQDPEKFDPYRFTRLRSKDAEGGGNHLQFASVTHGTMAFGWGKHACPGRFFAAAEIKLILLHMLLNFEVSVVPGPDGVKRYPNVEMGNMNMPDFKRRVLFKSIRG
uniref:Ent-kaurene oxidase n=1 Tax=Pyricularia oryzae (strain P131) TaxID=1143193 RepID=L7JGD0_PYRO1